MEWNSKERRSDIRVPLLSESVTLQGLHYIRNLQMLDVSAGGIFIKVEDNGDLLPNKEFITILFHLPGDLGIFELYGEVCRINWAISKKSKVKVEKGMAIKFWDIPETKKKIWDSYRIYLRNKQIITVSKRIIEEFFGKEK